MAHKAQCPRCGRPVKVRLLGRRWVECSCGQGFDPVHEEKVCRGGAFASLGETALT